MRKMALYLHSYSTKISKVLVLKQLLYLIILHILISTQAIAEADITEVPLLQSSQLTLRVCYEDKNNFPFIIEDNRSSTNVLGTRGTLADIIIKAAKAIELPITFSRLPWKRCIQHLSHGKVDAIFAAIWTPERDALWVFPKVDDVLEPKRRLWRAKYPIFTAKNSTLQWHDGRFTGVRLGVSAPLGYVAHDKLDKLGVLPTNNLTPEEGFTLIARERLDGYVIERFIGNNIIKKLKLSQELSSLEEDFMQMDWFMPVSHTWYQQHPQLTQQLWLSLSQVRELQGDEIFKHYTEPNISANP